MLQKLLGSVSGYKTYITLIVGVFIALLGALWGPIHVGPVDIPQVQWPDFWKIVWEALAASFLRSGVSKSGPVTPTK